MCGLALALVGVSFACLGLNSFPRFLFTIALLGAGTAILQVAGNPLMRDVSSKGKYARNLSLGQFVKAIGSLSGPVLPVVAARYFGVSLDGHLSHLQRGAGCGTRGCHHNRSSRTRCGHCGHSSLMPGLVAKSLHAGNDVRHLPLRWGGGLSQHRDPLVY